MRRIPRTEQALRLANSPKTSPYVCHTCRAALAPCNPSQRRTFTSTPIPAEEKLPFYKRVQQTLFGKDEKVDIVQQRDDKRRARAEQEAAESEDSKAKTVTDHRTGREYEVADVVDPAVSKDYVPATELEGLEWVGGKRWVKERADLAEREGLGAKREFVGFSPPTKLQLSYEEWIRLLHHVTVEVLALYKNGRDVNDICNLRAEGARSWEKTISTTIDVRADGSGVALRFADPADEQRILASVSNKAPEEEHNLDDVATVDRLGLGQQQQLEGVFTTVGAPVAEKETINRWLALPLTAAPEIKLAIMKRLCQVTGARPSDPVVSSASSLGDLLHAFRARPKPKKLYERKEMKELRKQDMGNVQVYSNRRTPIHREKEVGRWKVIEKALVERGLPVTGSRWQGSKLQTK